MDLNYYDNTEENLKKESFIRKFQECISEEKNSQNYCEIVFLCIGTDRLIGDCFGPLVGSKLEERFRKLNISNFNVYGTLRENICYTNIKEYIKKLKLIHPNACIVTIDAALAEKSSLGNIYVEKKKTKIAKGLNKENVEVGDISIRAVVGKNYKLSNYNFFSLQNVSLNEVMKLSIIVADGIYEVIKYI